MDVTKTLSDIPGRVNWHLSQLVVFVKAPIFRFSSTRRCRKTAKRWGLVCSHDGKRQALELSVRVCGWKCVHAVTHVCVSISIWVLVFVCVYTQASVLCVYMCICMRCMCVHAFMQECACVHVFTCACVRRGVVTTLLKVSEGLFGHVFVFLWLFMVCLFWHVFHSINSSSHYVFFLHTYTNNRTKLVLLFKGLCTGLCVHVHVSVCMCIYLYVNACVFICTCMHVHASVCMRVSTYISPSRCIYSTYRFPVTLHDLKLTTCTVISQSLVAHWLISR